MIKKNLFLLFVIYFFVLQLGIVAFLWWDHRFYLLAGINLVAILLVVGLYLLFNKTSSQEKIAHTPVQLSQSHYEKRMIKSDDISREIDETSLVQDNHQLWVEEPLEKTEMLPEKKESVKNLKEKIVALERPKAKKWMFWIRLLLFILELGGIVRLLYHFRAIFSFWVLALGALLMLFLITLIYKGLGLWKKSIWSNLAFLFFFLLMLVALASALLDENAPFRQEGEQLIETILLKVDRTIISDEKEQDFLLDREGILSFPLSELGGNIESEIDWEHDEGGLDSNEGDREWNEGEDESEKEPDLSQNFVENQEINFLDAVKYLLKKNEVSLSASQKYTFPGLVKNSEDYSYMATAADLKLLGNNANPKTKTSCDVYMVFKGLVEKWPIVQTADVKWDYRKYAERNNLLNTCKKGKTLMSNNL